MPVPPDDLPCSEQNWLDGNCPGVPPPPPPPPECEVMQMATKQDMYFRTQYDPAGLVSANARLIRIKSLANLQGSIDKSDATLASKFGAEAPVDVKWHQFPMCMWTSDGRPGGADRSRYFSRNAIAGAGYQPRPILGGASLADTLPTSLTKSMPVWLDRVLNPDLAIVVIFVMLVVIFGILIYKAYRQSTPITPATKVTKSKMALHD